MRQGGYENLPFVEKDVRNYINKVKGLQLGEGDANAMYNYFSQMQSDNSNFFYLMDIDEEGALRMFFGQMQGVGQHSKNLVMWLHLTQHTWLTNTTCHLRLL